MNEKEKYIKIPLIKSVESIKRIENGELHDFDIIYYNDINNSYKPKKFYAYNTKISCTPRFLSSFNTVIQYYALLYHYIQFELQIVIV